MPYIQIDKFISGILDDKPDYITLIDDNLDLNDMIKVYDALKKNTSVTSITIYKIKYLLGYEYLADMLKENSTIKRIDLCGNNVGPDGAKHIASALKENTTLNSLALTNTQLGDEGVKYICDALKVNTGLIYVSMGYNNVTQIGCESICEMIKCNTTLNLLHTSDYEINSHSIINALKDNYYITTLFFKTSNTTMNHINDICYRNKHNLKLKASTLDNL
jgi:hypothetical protein